MHTRVACMCISVCLQKFSYGCVSSFYTVSTLSPEGVLFFPKEDIGCVSHFSLRTGKLLFPPVQQSDAALSVRETRLFHPDDRGRCGICVTAPLLCGWQTWGKAVWHLRGLRSGDDMQPCGPAP